MKWNDSSDMQTARHKQQHYSASKDKGNCIESHHDVNQSTPDVKESKAYGE